MHNPVFGITPSPASVVGSGSTTARSLADRFGEVKNVKDFGAKGQGTTDDLEALQRAFNRADADGGGIVFLPDGTYIIPNSWNLFGSKVSIIGASRGSAIIKRQDNSETGGEHMLMIGEGTANNADHVRVARLTLDGNRANNTGGPESTHNIRIENATDVLIEDVESKNAIYYGLHIRGEDATTKRITVRDFHVHTSGRDCIDVKNQNGHTGDIVFSGVVAENPGLQAVSNDACFDFRGPMIASDLVANLPGTRHHGIRLRGTDNSSVEGRMTLSNFKITGNGSHTLDALLLIEGIETKVSNGLVQTGGVEGVQIQGPRTHLVNVESRNNTGDGFWLRDAGGGQVGERCKLVACFASSNTRDGFDIDTSRNRLIACEARSNTLDGFNIISAAALNSFPSCESSGNSGNDWVDGGVSTMFAEYRTTSASFTLSSGGNATITFAEAFPNAILSVVASTEGDPITTAEHLTVDTLTASNFVVRFRPNPGAVVRAVRYIAWGN